MAFGWSIDVTALSGTISANALSPSNVTNPTDAITSNTNWTAGSTKYLLASAPESAILKSIDSARDVEVVTWVRNGTVYLRVDNTGKGYFFSFNLETANSQLEIGILTGLEETHQTYSDGTYYYLYRNSDLVGTVSGYSKTNTDLQKFKVGCSGLDIYAKFSADGGSTWVTICTFRDYLHCVSGRMWLKAVNGYGFRSITTTVPSVASFTSDPVNGVIAAADFGVSAVHTTGSMSLGSNDLAVASAAGFSVNDWVIVATGGESGAGARGTKGVGGVWPALSYANLTAMNADTSQPTNRVAWLLSTGIVYQWDGAAWAIHRPTNYYLYRALPIALQARITAIVGSVLTLDTAATVATTNANVYRDNLPHLHYIAGRPRSTPGLIQSLLPITPSDLEIVLPSGVFAIGGKWTVTDRTGITIRGQGRDSTELVSPDGVRGAEIVLDASVGATVEQLTLRSNFRPTGFGLGGPAFYHTTLYGGLRSDGSINGVRDTDDSITTELGAAQGYVPSGGINFTSDNGTVQDARVIDVAMGAVRGSFVDNVWAYRLEVIQTSSCQTYSQWRFEFDSCTNSGATDCTFYSDTLWGVVEFFKGGSGCKFERCLVVNGSFSLNATDGWEVNNCTVIVTANSQPVPLDVQDSSWNIGNAMVGCSTNTGGGSPTPTGTINNMVIDIRGVINANNDIPRGIVVSGANGNGEWTGVQINGGCYKGPNYAAPSILAGPAGVVSQGNNTHVSCFTVIGQIKSGTPDFDLANIGIESGTITNCRAGSIYGRAGQTTLTGNGAAADPLNAACGREFTVHTV